MIILDNTKQTKTLADVRKCIRAYKLLFNTEPKIKAKGHFKSTITGEEVILFVFSGVEKLGNKFIDFDGIQDPMKPGSGEVVYLLHNEDEQLKREET